MDGKSPDEVVRRLDEELKKVVEAYKRELQKVRTGRASAGLVENLSVEYYGSKTHLSHLAQISSPEPRQILIQAYDVSAVPAIEKAIQAANLGLNPSREGNILRVSVPTLTQEARRDIVRHLHKMTEDMRVSARNHRRDANEFLKKLEKDSAVSKDDIKRSMERVQKLTDASITEIDKNLAAKEQEFSEV